MTMKQTSKKELIIIKSVEPEGWGKTDPCLSGGIPPLGTNNVFGNITTENVSGDEAEPFRGAFEILLGKTSLSFKTEPDKADSQDIDGTPKTYIRGHDTYSGQLEFDQLKNNLRLQGAVDGHWDPDDLVYTPYKDFRLFEIWTLVNPTDADGNCDMSLNATKCDALMKHYEIVLDSVDESRDIPNKLTIPISRRLYQRFKNVEFPSATQAMLTAQAIGAGATYTLASGEKFPREHTRLHFIVSVGATGLLTVYGANIFGEPMIEVLDVSKKDASNNLVGHAYFTRVDKIHSSAAVTVTLQDFDYKLQNPL